MIQQILQLTNKMLDQYLFNAYGFNEKKVLVNRIVNDNGSIPKLNKNKVIITLLNAEKETTNPYYNQSIKQSDNNYITKNPMISLNLDLLITSNFDDYNESLKFLDTVLQYYQKFPAIDTSTNNDLPDGLQKINYSIEKIGYLEMHNLWGSMGAKFQPSVIYKVKSVFIDSDDLYGFDRGISQISNEVPI